MFADVTPVEETRTLASYLPIVGWGILGVLALVVAWKLWSNRATIDLTVLTTRVRAVLVKFSRPAPPAREAAAPAAQEGSAPAAPVETPPVQPAATTTAPPQQAAADDAAPEWLDKALVAIASIPTLLALPWAAYAVSQHLPVPTAVALPLGILFDVAMVGAVLVALLVPSVSRQASTLGWIAAIAASVAIAAYTGISGALVFAATPLISKALWGLLITIRRQRAEQAAAHAAARVRREEEESAARKEREAQEAAAEAEQAEKAAELSTDLTHEEQRQVAEKKRLAKFKRDMAAAELELDLAESEAEHLAALAKIKRLGEQQRAEDKEAAEVFEQRLRLDRQLRTLQGKSPSFLSASSADGVEDAEVVPAISAQVGFGGGQQQAFGFQRPLDVRALTPEGAQVRFEDLPDHHQALVKYVHAAKEPSLREAGRKLDRDQRTIGRWVDKLTELGYPMPFERKK